MTKLSKKQRDERRQTLRLLMGAGVGVAVLSGGLLVGTRLMGPPTALTGQTLAERIQEAGVEGFGMTLVGESAQPDVVVIGSSDCGFCRSFVENGLTDFVEKARELGLTVQYFPMAGGLGSLSSTLALECLKGLGADRVGVLRATYAISAEVNDNQLGRDDFAGLIEKQAAILGGSVDAAECLSGDPLAAATRTKAISEAFDLRGTPSFYVAAQDNPRDIRLFSGFSSSDATVRQLEHNRTQ